MEETEQKQLLKGYESKIIQLSTQLETLTTEKEELTSENERVRGLLAHSNSELQLKSGLLQDKTNTNQKLRKEIEDLEGILKGAQYHRKVLFDHMFTSEMPYISNEFEHRKNNLVSKICDLKSEFVGNNYVQFEEIINSRNNEIRALTQRYNDLAKQHMKSINEYQVKINELKEQNMNLKRNEKNKTNIEKKIKEFKNNRAEEFEIAYNNLEERLDLVLERLRISQGVIKELKQELGEYKRKEREEKIRVECESGNNVVEIDEFLKAVSENKSLRKEVDEMNEKYEKLVIEFPNIVKNEDQILDFIHKHQKLSQLETDQKLKIIKIEELEQTIAKIKEENVKLQKQVREKIIENDGTVQSYDVILEKFKEFFTMVNPYYGIYAYEQLGLESSELELLRKGKSASKETLLRTELNKLEEKNSYLQIELSSKASQISKQTTLIESHVSQIEFLQSSNSKLLETINTNIIQENHCADDQYMEYLLSSFTKIQEERDKLQIECKDREIKIMELMVEVSYLRANKSDEGEEGNRGEMDGESLEEEQKNTVDACQSSIVWVNFNEDMSKFQSKLTELEAEIHETNCTQNESIQQLHSSYQSQILNLKQTIEKLQYYQQSVSKTAEVEHKNIQEERRKENNEPLPDHGSLIDIDPMSLNQEGMEQPINSLSAENIQELSKILSGHEINLKNVLSAYNSLKEKFVQLQEKYNQTTLEANVEQMTQSLERLVNELKAAEIRINESDKNVLFLEDEIQSKSLELNQVKEQSNQEIDVLKVMVEGLKKENEELKQDNWLEKEEAPTQSIVNKSFPEEIQYLVELVVEKSRQICEIKKEKKKNECEQQFDNIENKKCEEMKNKEFEEFEKLVNNGELLNVLGMAIERFQSK